MDGPQWPPRHDGDEWSWESQSKQARKEWEQIQERSVRAQRYLRSNGYLVGRPPFGYRIVCAERCGKIGQECRHHKTLGPDPRLVPYVSEMASRYLNGATFTSICEWLDSEGIKPSGGGVWKQKTVRTVLSNPVLIGRRKDGQGRTILRFEPILDQVTFKRLQARLEATRAKPARGATAEAPALLAGVIHCAWCGRVMYRRSMYNVRKDGSKQYNLYYRCDGSLRDRSTCKNMIPLKEADDWVSSWFAGTIGHLELTERMVIPGHNHEDEIAEVAAEIRDLDLDDPDYLVKQSALMAERKRLKELPAAPSEIVERPTGVTVGQHWGGLDTAGRRAWLLDRQVKVMAYRPPAKGHVPEGAPPFAFDVGFQIAGVLMRRTADGAYEIAKDQPATGQEIPESDHMDAGQLAEWVRQHGSE